MHDSRATPINEDGEPDLPVGESPDKILELEFVSRVDLSFSRSRVLLQARTYELLLVGSEPSRALDCIGEDEEDSDTGQHRDHALEDKDPSPSSQASDTIWKD